jgi:hypothetical protein
MVSGVDSGENVAEEDLGGQFADGPVGVGKVHEGPLGADAVEVSGGERQVRRVAEVELGPQSGGRRPPPGFGDHGASTGAGGAPRSVVSGRTGRERPAARG